MVEGRKQQWIGFQWKHTETLGLPVQKESWNYPNCGGSWVGVAGKQLAMRSI